MSYAAGPAPTEGLGWEPAFEAPGEVVFFRMAPTIVLSLWRDADFETEAGSINRGPGTAPITLSHNVPAPKQDVMRAAGLLP